MGKAGKQIYRTIKKGENINPIKMTNKKASAVLWISIVVVVLIVLGIGAHYLLTPVDWEKLDNTPQTDFQCKNSVYSTVRNSYQNNLITLTSSSEEKLFKELSEKGTVALNGLSDLNCLEYIFIISSKIDDLFALSSLTNLKELTFMGLGVTDLSPLANLNNLEKLKITRLNTFNNISPLLNLKQLKELSLPTTDEQCSQLKESLPNTEVTCRNPSS